MLDVSRIHTITTTSNFFWPLFWGSTLPQSSKSLQTFCEHYISCPFICLYVLIKLFCVWSSFISLSVEIWTILRSAQNPLRVGYFWWHNWSVLRTVWSMLKRSILMKIFANYCSAYPEVVFSGFYSVAWTFEAVEYQVQCFYMLWVIFKSFFNGRGPKRMYYWVYMVQIWYFNM